MFGVHEFGTPVLLELKLFFCLIHVKTKQKICLFYFIKTKFTKLNWFTCKKYVVLKQDFTNHLESNNTVFPIHNITALKSDVLYASIGFF